MFRLHSRSLKQLLTVRVLFVSQSLCETRLCEAALMTQTTKRLQNSVFYYNV